MLFVKDGSAAVFTFQPYGLGWTNLRDLVRECEAHGLEASIGTWPAWHSPGDVLFVEVKRGS